MKSLIKNMLREEKSQNDIKNEYAKNKVIALKFLNSLRLEPWENKKYAMQYLATRKGKIIIMLTDSELIIQNGVYGVLKQVLKTSEKFNYFINDFISNKGINLMFSSINPSITTFVGDIEDDDIPMTQNIQESVEKNPLKTYFFKKWDRQRESGKIPKFNQNELKKLGLFEYQKEIRNTLLDYYKQYYTEPLKLLIENSIKNKVYSTTDITNYLIDIGNYNFEFKFTKFKITDLNVFDSKDVPSINLKAEFVITNGSVVLFGLYPVEEKDLVDPANQVLYYWWEVLNEINDIIVAFIKQLVLDFGLEVSSKMGDFFVSNKTYEKNTLIERQLSNFGYRYNSNPNFLSSIGLENVLVGESKIVESENKNQLKKFFFKKWSNQKKSGVRPKLNARELNSLGLSNFKNEIISYYVEFMGLDPDETNKRTETIKNYLLNNTFNEKDAPMITEWLEQGKMEFKFVFFDFFENFDGLLNVDVAFKVLNGSYYNEEENVIINFSNDDLQIEDMGEYFEFSDLLIEIIQNFIGKTIEDFGFDLNKQINRIDVRRQ